MRLELSNLSFTYPGAAAAALNDCSLGLDTGRVTLLAGGNGAGKSTLIRLLTGQLMGYSGSYHIDGSPAQVEKGELPARHRFGYAPEIPVLDSVLTAAEIIELVGEFRGLSRDSAAEDFTALKHAFDIGDWAEAQVCGEYSKGMRKKTALCIALIGDPDYAFLDEPFDGLDPISIFRLKNYLQQRRDRGRGVLLSSHLLDVAEKIADDVVLIKQGSILYQGGCAALTGGSEGHTGSLDEIYFELYSRHGDENLRT